MDLARQLGDLLGQLLVLPGEIRIRLEQCRQLVRLSLDQLYPLGGPAFHLVVSLLRAFTHGLVPLGLARLGQQDQRRRIGRLGREGEIQKDERIRVPVLDQRNRVECDPEDDGDRLSDDVLRRPEEARSLLCRTAERILTEGAVVGYGYRG